MTFGKILRRCLNYYRYILKTHPISTQSVQTGTLMGIGDLISQLYVEEKTFRTLNYRRNIEFFGLGAIWIGPVCQVWYWMLEKSFYHGTLYRTLQKLVIDQLFFAPVMTGLVMVINGMLQHMPWDENIHRLRKDFPNIMLRNYQVWPLIQLLNFYFVPLNFQVLAIQAIALFWNIYVSWILHKPSLYEPVITKSQTNDMIDTYEI